MTSLRREAPLVGLDMRSDKYEADNIRFGSMALVTTSPDVSARTAWEGGSWWDSFQKWVDEYAKGGTVADSHTSEPTPDGQSNYATLAPRMTLARGESRSVEFILSWYFPLRENYWNREVEVRGRKLRNHYGTAFKDAWDVASYTAKNLDRLEKATRAFHQSLVSTTLPSAALDAVSSQMSIIRTNTCLLLEGRQFFAFEGNNDDSGCCPMNCTHVWNYEQALAHLFPGARAIDADDRLHRQPPGRRRDGVSDTVANRTCALEVQARGRRPDGLCHEALSRVAAFRRRPVPARAVAVGQTGAGVRVETLGRRPGRRHGRRTAQHVRHRVLRPEHDDGHALPRRTARGRAHGARDGTIQPPPTSTTRCSRAAARSSIAISGRTASTSSACPT